MQLRGIRNLPSRDNRQLRRQGLHKVQDSWQVCFDTLAELKLLADPGQRLPELFWQGTKVHAPSVLGISAVAKSCAFHPHGSQWWLSGPKSSS